MAKGYIGPVSGRVHGQLARFLVAGSITVAVDFTIYRLLLGLSAPVLPAKAASFVTATALAYLLNRSWTFKARGSAARAAAFAALYGVTLLVNVGVNALALRLLGDTRWSVELAFLAAQACSTTLNFLAMRYLVFRHDREAAAPEAPVGQQDRSEAPLPRSGQPTG